jgi:Xaa-Pro aminopeptidase
LQKLRSKIAEKSLDALLVSHPENCRYLSGFTGSSGWLLISNKHAFLATDFRYVEQAKKEAPNFEVIQIKGSVPDWLPELISDLGWHRLGFETGLSFATFQQLGEAAKTIPNLELVPTASLVEHLRSIKEAAELELISQAVKLTDAAFEYLGAIIHPGMREKELAWEIEKFLRQNGSEAMPFEIIVASGPNSALPHARPTERVIRSGEPVLVDMGAKVNGYCSDFSRTLSLGKDKMLVEIYNVVLEAQLSAIEGIRAGMSAVKADQLAREVIARSEYNEAFGHGLGHGVGLEVHELPTLGPNSQDVLADDMVFTIEPGIYIAGWGGIRIEDMVTLKEGKAQVLTRSRKDSYSASFQ